MIGEGKKISDLPMILDFTDSAVVTIVEKGVTAKMQLALLIQKIEERVVGADGTLSTRIKKNAEGVAEAKKAANDVNNALKEFQNTAGGRFAEQDKTIYTMQKSLSGAIYYKNEVTLANNADDMTMSALIKMTDLAIDDTFDYAARLQTGARGAYTLHLDVKQGDILEAGYAITATGNAPYVVVTDADQMVIDLVPVPEFQANGYTFQEDGSVYISAMQPESTDSIVFYHKEPVDLTVLVDRVTDLEKANKTMTNTIGALQGDIDEIMGILKDNNLA